MNKVTYDRVNNLALFTDGKRFTQVQMNERSAEAIAIVFGATFEVSGTPR